MRMIFKVSYYVRSNYENKQGKSPLMIRIYLNREMLTVGSSGLNVDKKLWCNATSRMKGRTQEALCINAQLDEISTSFQEIFKRYEKDDDLTLEKIKSIYLGKDKIISQSPNIRLKDGTLAEGKKIMIDGQQRVTALMTAIMGIDIINSDFQKKRIKIAFNPLANPENDEERFKVQDNASEIRDGLPILLKYSNLVLICGSLSMIIVRQIKK